MTLFHSGHFLLPSGSLSSYKIDCDALTDEGWETLARIIAGRFHFDNVAGVPTGGLKLVPALEKWRTHECWWPPNRTLIVDDAKPESCSCWSVMHFQTFDS